LGPVNNKSTLDIKQKGPSWGTHWRKNKKEFCMGILPELTSLGVVVAAAIILLTVIIAVAIAYKNRDNF
jgi:hypothetical protein